MGDEKNITETVKPKRKFRLLPFAVARDFVRRLGLPTPAAYQAVVPAGSWFGAELAEPDGYALVGCTVAPGFEFSEFELADTDALLAGHPGHGDLIRRLAPKQG